MYVSTIDLRYRPCSKCGDWFEPKLWQAKKAWWYCLVCRRVEYAIQDKRRRNAPEKYKQSRNAPGYRQRPEVKEHERQQDLLRRSKPKYKQKRREYLQRPEVKERERLRHYKVWRERYYNPDQLPKNRARQAVRNAVRDGRLVKMPCSICGNTRSEGHHLNYAEPLNVVWLCSACHAAEHQRISRAVLPARRSCDS